MSFLFDKDTAEISRVAESLRVPQQFRDPFSFGVNVGGREAVSFNQTGPTSGGINVAGAPGFQSSLNRATGANTAANTRLGGLIGNLQSNQNPFINARVRPLEDANRENIASVTRDVGRRNIQGSLGQNQISNARITGDQAIGDARAIATNEALNAQIAAEGARLGVGDETLAIAQTQMKGELAQIDAAMTALQTALGNQTQLTNQLSGVNAGGVGDGLSDIEDITNILRDFGLIT